MIVTLILGTVAYSFSLKKADSTSVLSSYQAVTLEMWWTTLPILAFATLLPHQNQKDEGNKARYPNLGLRSEAHL